MKKYNLSAIMKRAWVIFKANMVDTFSQALKRAWAEIKALSKRFSISSWFFNKNLGRLATQHLVCYNTFGMEDIIKESEKAVFVNLEMRTKSGIESRYSRKIWIPKSCVEEYYF